MNDLAEQYPRDGQGNENIKELSRKKCEQRFPARGVKQITELGLQPDTGESQYKPKILDTFQPILHAINGIAAKEKREQQRCGYKSYHKLGKSIPDHAESWFFC